MDPVEEYMGDSRMSHQKSKAQSKIEENRNSIKIAEKESTLKGAKEIPGV